MELLEDRKLRTGLASDKDSDRVLIPLEDSGSQGRARTSRGHINTRDMNTILTQDKSQKGTRTLGLRMGRSTTRTKGVAKTLKSSSGRTRKRSRSSLKISREKIGGPLAKTLLMIISIELSKRSTKENTENSSSNTMIIEMDEMASRIHSMSSSNKDSNLQSLRCSWSTR